MVENIYFLKMLEWLEWIYVFFLNICKKNNKFSGLVFLFFLAKNFRLDFDGFIKKEKISLNQIRVIFFYSLFFYKFMKKARTLRKNVP